MILSLLRKTSKEELKRHIQIIQQNAYCCSNIARGGGVRDDVYEDPDSNTLATGVSAVQGGEVWEDTYEPLDMLGVVEDSKYVNTATTTACRRRSEGGYILCCARQYCGYSSYYCNVRGWSERECV